ncbi:Uncharacterised protein [uncultured Flavonifractor sp.]|nr:Uncharacterised protein [uncultured Flavonifractor sp.]
MKRSEVTTEALKRMGYKAMVSYTSWNSHSEYECNAKQSAELFELVAKTTREGGKVEIRRRLVRGVVTVHVYGADNMSPGSKFCYFLQRRMTNAEILEESIRSGLWVSWR